MMGAGKSTLGRSAAKALGWRFYDLDKLVERKANMSIPQIFEECGEDRFRQLETEVLREFQGKESIVLSVGGGAPMREGNLEIMRGIGKVVYLRATREALIERLSKSAKPRPLLKGQELGEVVGTLLKQRSEMYSLADATLDVSRGGPRQLTRRLVKIAEGE